MTSAGSMFSDLKKPNTQQRTGQAIQKVGTWHEMILDWILLNPDKTQGECAAHFGVTEGWLSRVVNSDAFQEFKLAYMANHHERVSETVISKVESLTKVSLDVMQERIEKERADIPIATVKDVAALTLGALGYTGRASTGNGNGRDGDVNITVNVERSDLQRARERMKTIPRRELEVIEHDETQEAAAPGGALPASSGL